VFICFLSEKQIDKLLCCHKRGDIDLPLSVCLRGHVLGMKNKQ